MLTCIILQIHFLNLKLTQTLRNKISHSSLHKYLPIHSSKRKSPILIWHNYITSVGTRYISVARFGPPGLKLHSYKMCFSNFFMTRSTFPELITSCCLFVSFFKYLSMSPRWQHRRLLNSHHKPRPWHSAIQSGGNLQLPVSL